MLELFIRGGENSFYIPGENSYLVVIRDDKSPRVIELDIKLE